MIKSGVYMLAGGNLIEVESFLTAGEICVVDVYFFFDHIQIYSEEFSYLFSGAEYLGEL